MGVGNSGLVEMVVFGLNLWPWTLIRARRETMCLHSEPRKAMNDRNDLRQLRNVEIWNIYSSICNLRWMTQIMAVQRLLSDELNLALPIP